MTRADFLAPRDSLPLWRVSAGNSTPEDRDEGEPEVRFITI